MNKMNKMRSIFVALKSRILRVTALDSHSLGIGRLVFSAALIYDFIQRVTNYTLRYHSDNLIIRNEPLAIFNYIDPSPEILLCIGIFYALTLIGVTLGYKTKINTIISWFLYYQIYSISYFNEYVLDLFFLLVLFRMMFIPRGKSFSMDAYLHDKNRKGDNSKISSIWHIGLFVQLINIYATAVGNRFFNTFEHWFVDGLGLLNITAKETVMREFALNWFSQIPSLIKRSSIRMNILELSLIPLILFSSQKYKTRNIAVYIYVILHTSLGLTMHIGALSRPIVATRMMLYQKDNIAKTQESKKNKLSEQRGIDKSKKILSIVLIIISIISMSYRNYSIVKKTNNQPTPQKIQKILHSIPGLKQHRNIFGGSHRDDSRIQFQGYTQYHTTIGINNTNQELSFFYNNHYYTSERMEKFISNVLREKRNKGIYAQHICDEYNKGKLAYQQIEMLDVFKVTKHINSSTLKEQLLFTWNCKTNKEDLPPS